MKWLPMTVGRYVCGDGSSVMMASLVVSCQLSEEHDPFWQLATGYCQLIRKLRDHWHVAPVLGLEDGEEDGEGFAGFAAGGLVRGGAALDLGDEFLDGGRAVGPVV